MNKRFLALAAFLLSMLTGCSGGAVPVQPSLNANQVLATQPSANRSQTCLWGYYEVYIRPETFEVDIVQNRHAEFTVNVVNFLNQKAGSLGIKINEILTDASGTSVDVDVSLTHPFPGMPQYNGYDVRGVFMGDGSSPLKYNSALTAPAKGVDQVMLNDPDDKLGGPDGYTRWFNRPEFSGGGMPLFQYTQGKAATPGYLPSATLNPYKYFASGLGATEDLWTWLTDNGHLHGVFPSGATLSRNYYLFFPSGKGVKFGYAVIANWSGTESQYHPSNAPEAVGCHVTDQSDVWYAGPSQKGGNIILDISLWDWDSHISGGVMKDYTIYIESTVLQNVHKFSEAEMTPIGGGDNFSTFHVEIPADNINSSEGNTYWVIAECSDETYANDFGVHNAAENDPVAAFFRYDLTVLPEPPNQKPVCSLIVVTPMPAKGWNQVEVEFDASGSYDPEGGPLTFEWDFDGDGIYGENPDDSYSGTSDHPTHAYTDSFNGVVRLRLTDAQGKVSVCLTDPLDVTVLAGCEQTDVPSGKPSSCYADYSNSCRSGITRAVGASGKEYFIGHKRDYYGKRYGFYAMDAGGTVTHDYLSPSQPDYPPTLQGMVCTSKGRIYVITYTQYSYYDYILYYVDFDEATGFSGLLKQAEMPSIAPWYYVKITVDQNDNPVALVGNGMKLAVKHWNGSSWQHIDIADSATMYAECGYWNNGIEDIAYQPVTGEYWITNRYHGYTPYYDGVPTLYVIKGDGTTAWKDTNIYPGVPLYSQYSVGVDIDVHDPDCRTLLLICCGSTGVNQFVARFTRYDPFGNQTGTGLMDAGAPRYELANGVVISSGGQSYYAAPLDLSGLAIGITKVPDW